MARDFRASVEPLLALVAAFVTAALVLAVGAGPDPAATPDRALPLEVLSVALASRPAPAGVSADAVAFHRARLADRPDEPLSRRALVGLHLARFRAYGTREELAEAGRLLDELEARYPRDPAVHGMAAEAALAVHDVPGALRHARRAARLSPAGDPGGRFRLFDALWADGAYGPARTLLERTETVHPTPALLSREARLLDGLGDVEAAARLMEEATRLVDAYAESPLVRAWARVEAGTFLHHAGRTRAGVARYREALSLVPGYPPAVEALAWVAYGVDEDLPAAEALFRRALANGGHLELYPVLAEIAAARGDTVRARTYRAAFLETATGDPVTERLNLRPLAQVLAGDPATRPTAVAYARRDVELRRDRGAWATLGWVLARAGRLHEAADAAERAVAWGTPPPAVLRLAGLTLLEAGDPRRGRRLLHRALAGRAELGPVASAGIEARLAAP